MPKSNSISALSKLRYPATFDQIAYAAAHNLSKGQFLPQADFSRISRAENIHIAGPTGSGKSYLACAVDHQSCLLGYHTLYFNVNRFPYKIMLSKLDGSVTKLLDQLEKSACSCSTTSDWRPWTKQPPGTTASPRRSLWPQLRGHSLPTANCCLVRLHRRADTGRYYTRLAAEQCTPL